MHTPESLRSIEGMDIYLIDQILKGRYQKGEAILDAGAGGGRNLNWFFQSGFDITACDVDPEREALIRIRNPEAKFAWASCDLSEMPFPDEAFQHVVCNAVLHFAQDEKHFKAMFAELLRVLKKGGSLFIRTCGNMSIEDKVIAQSNGQSIQPDGATRFLLTPRLLQDLKQKHSFQFLEPFKYVNVEDQRVMCTMVLVKG